MAGLGAATPGVFFLILKFFSLRSFRVRTRKKKINTFPIKIIIDIKKYCNTVSRRRRFYRKSAAAAAAKKKRRLLEPLCKRTGRRWGGASQPPARNIFPLRSETWRFRNEVHYRRIHAYTEHRRFLFFKNKFWKRKKTVSRILTHRVHSLYAQYMCGKWAGKSFWRFQSTIFHVRTIATTLLCRIKLYGNSGVHWRKND